jgi:hypothetical protein
MEKASVPETGTVEFRRTHFKESRQLSAPKKPPPNHLGGALGLQTHRPQPTDAARLVSDHLPAPHPLPVFRTPSLFNPAVVGGGCLAQG